METVLERLARGSRVALIRLRSLGDCVLTTPAIEILRRCRPDLKIAVVVEPRFGALFENNPDIDAVLPPRLADLRRWRPDLAINLHGGTRSLALTSACNARFRAGFAHLRGARLYNIRVPTAQEIFGVERKVHTAEHLASVIFYLGAERCDIPKAKLFTKGAVEPRPIAVIHPLASAPDKTWPAENFVAIAGCLRDRWGLEPVFIGAATDDLNTFREFKTIAGASLSEIKSLIASASLFIGNDSGPAHIAAAVKTPLVVLFGPASSQRWRPWRAPAEVVQNYFACNPCAMYTCEAFDEPECIRSISVEQVMGAVDRLLGNLKYSI